MSVGEKLRILRKKMKKTLKEQSETFGVSLNSIYRWEHDLAVPKKPVLEKMAAFYDVSLEWLLKDNAEEEETHFGGSMPRPEDNTEQQLLRMFRKLSESNKYKILGYVERICVEDMDKSSRTLRLVDKKKK